VEQKKISKQKLKKKSMKKKQRHSKLRGVNERKKKYATSKEEFTGKDCTKNKCSI